MARSYPRDKKTAERLLTVQMAKTYRWLWECEANDDEYGVVQAEFRRYGLLQAARALGLDDNHIDLMAQRYNALTAADRQEEYGDLDGPETSPAISSASD